MARKPKEESETHNLILRGNVWYVKYMLEGKRIVKCTGATTLKAARGYRDRELELKKLTDERERTSVVQTRLQFIDRQLDGVKDRVTTMTLSAAWDAFKVKPKGKTARGRVIKPGERTLRDYHGRWMAFVDWMDENYPKKDGEGNKVEWNIREITREHAEKYMAHVDSEWSGNTFNKTLTFLRLVFKVLEGDARIRTNPFDGIDAARHAIAKKRPLTVTELSKIAGILDGKGEMEVLFALGYYTGARLGDCVLMRWGANVDLGSRRIRYTPHKTAKGNREITLSVGPELCRLLEATPVSRRKGFVLPELSGLYQTSPTILNRRIQRVFKDAEIDTREAVKGYGNKVARVGFHSLRHAHITAMIEAGIPLDVVQQQAGHTTIGMTAHYHTISPKALLAASQAIPAMGPKPVEALPVGVVGQFLAQIEALSDADLKKVADAVGKESEKRRPL